MKNLLVLLFNAFLFANSIHAQKPEVIDSYPKNSLYVELLGSGIFYSINYERMITNKISARAGVGYTFGAFDLPLFQKMISLPVSASYHQRIKHNLHFEAGIGVTYTYDFEDSDEDDFFLNDERAYTFIVPVIGIRHDDMQAKGMVFRMTVTPLYDPKYADIYPFLGLSLGYTF